MTPTLGGRKWRFRAAILAFTLLSVLSTIWASQAESAPETRASSKSGVTNIQLLGVNDFHGNLEPIANPTYRTPTDTEGNPTNVEGLITCKGAAAGGAAYLDAYLDRNAARDPDGTIRVHAGDMVGGSPLISSYFHDEPTIEATNLLQFDVGTLGNHEFDEGGQEMLRLIKGGQRKDGLQFKEDASGQPVNTSDPKFSGADYPYISANVVYADSGKNVLKPYTIVKRDGVKTGFIGVTTEETPDIVVPDAVAPFEFLDISDTVNRYAAELQKRGVETIVVLAHAGGTQTSATEATGEIISETAEMSDAVDVVVAGHSHSYLNTTVDDKLVVEGFSLGTAFDTVSLTVDRKTGDVIESSAKVVPSCNEGIQPDPETAALVAKYDEQITPIESRVVGAAATNITRDDSATAGESALGDVIADAQRTYAGTQIAFTNSGGIRADIQSGPVTYGELFSVQPFDNQVVKMNLTGDQIYRLLEQQWQPQANGSVNVRILQVSGLKFAYDESKPIGQRVTSVTLVDETPNGTPIDRNDTKTTYTVAANSFIATGGDGFTVFDEARATQQTLGGELDPLEAYFGSQQQVGIPEDFGQRITKQG
jgi:5'-nucleotidase